MNQFWDRITKYFSDSPKNFTGFYISPHYFCGVSLSAKERKISDYYIKTLPQGIVRPSLNEKNIVEEEILKQEFLKALKKVNARGKNIALVFPELSQKTFTFSLDSLPHSPREREQIIRFRIKKKMPFLPEDVRISYDLISKESGIRAVVILTRKFIVQEYEDFLDQLGLKVRAVVPPSVGLVNLLNFELDEDYFLLNVEQDDFSLSVYINSELVLYRQKRFDLGMEDPSARKDKVKDVFQEVENTLNLIEGSEKKKDLRFFVRCGMNNTEDLIEEASQGFSFPFHRIGSILKFDLNLKQAEKLSPILGLLT